MIDITTPPNGEFSRVENVHSCIYNAINGTHAEQKNAVQGLRGIARHSTINTHFVNVLRELWMIEKDDSQDEFNEEFNSLIYFLSGISTSLLNSVEAVELDDNYSMRELGYIRKDAESQQVESELLSLFEKLTPEKKEAFFAEAQKLTTDTQGADQ